MKKIISLLIVPVLVVGFSACGKTTEDFNKDVTGIAHDNEGFTYYTNDHSQPDTSGRFKVEELTAGQDQLTVDDGVNKYVYTLENGVVVKAEYAMRFGDQATAEQMFGFYEENGYSDPYSAGRVDGAYLIMTFSDQSPYLGKTERDIRMQSVGTAVRDVFSYSENGYTYNIPEIMLSGVSFDAVNSDIYTKYYTQLVEPAVSEIGQGGDPVLREVGYEWGEKQDVLSLCVYDQIEAADARYYDVYNLNEITGETLSGTDVIKLFGLSGSGYSDLLKTGIGDLLDKRFETAPGGYDDIVQDIYTKSLDSSNLDKSLPYINIDGDLCAVVFVYSIAGADGYYHTLNISELM